MDLEGNIIEEKVVQGLNAPKGMAIYKDKLYVTDIDTLVEIDLNSYNIAGRYGSREAIFLNDVTVSATGEVYITDTFGNKIFKLEDNQLTIFIDDKNLDNPNGITFNNGKLLLVSWSLPPNGGSGSFKEIALDGSNIDRVAGKIEGLDGIEAISREEYFVTCFKTGSLYYVDSGSFIKLFSNSEGYADLTYLKNKSKVIIPQMVENKVLILNVDI